MEKKVSKIIKNVSTYPVFLERVCVLMAKNSLETISFNQKGSLFGLTFNEMVELRFELEVMNYWNQYLKRLWFLKNGK